MAEKEARAGLRSLLPETRDSLSETGISARFQVHMACACCERKSLGRDDPLAVNRVSLVGGAAAPPAAVSPGDFLSEPSSQNQPGATVPVAPLIFFFSSKWPALADPLCSCSCSGSCSRGFCGFSCWPCDEEKQKRRRLCGKGRGRNSSWLCKEPKQGERSGPRKSSSLRFRMRRSIAGSDPAAAPRELRARLFSFPNQSFPIKMADFSRAVLSHVIALRIVSEITPLFGCFSWQSRITRVRPRLLSAANLWSLLLVLLCRSESWRTYRPAEERHSTRLRETVHESS
jgi:hypothetical protein